MNPKDICTLRNSVCTSPEQKWLVIHKETGEVREVCAISLHPPFVGYFTEDGLQETWNLSDCHLCASTGYTDSKGDTVFGGHLVKLQGHAVGDIYYVRWGDGEWCIENETSNMPLYHCDPKDITIIGHIHIPSGWSKILSDSEVPDEVKALLEKGKTNARQ